MYYYKPQEKEKLENYILSVSRIFGAIIIIQNGKKNLEGNIVCINDSALALFNANPDQLLSHTLSQFLKVPKNFVSRLKELSARKSSSFSSSIQYKAYKSKFQTVEVVVSRLEIENNHYLQFHFVQNVSGMISELREFGVSEVLEKLGIGLMLIEGDEIKYINPVGLTLLGYQSLPELPENTLISIVHKDYQEELLDYIKNILNEKLSGSALYSVLKNKKGQNLEVEINGSLLKDGRTIVVLTFFDISEVMAKHSVESASYRQKQLDAQLIKIDEQKKSLEESQRALIYALEDANISREELKNTLKKMALVNKELEAFSYSVSHDLRAPVRRISGYINLISERLGDQIDDDIKKYIERIIYACHEMNELIDNLLKLSRISRYDLQREEVDLSSLSRKILSNQDIPDKYQVKVHEKLIAFADPHLAFILMENLLLNAIKFSSVLDSPKIEVGKSRIDNEDYFFVKDNGVGFDPKYQDRLFQPFQRLHSEQEFQGMGIGLATVMRIINRHGGHILAKSQPGKGATFYFHFGHSSM